MKVYRVEHQDGRGPYAGCAVDDSTQDYYWSRNHPGPREDGLDFPIPDDHYFGFKSVRQLLDWFLLWDIWNWKKDGFAVYKYDIPDEYVRLGGRQLVFVRAQATCRREVRWLPFG